MSAGGRWERALEEHRAALEVYVAAAEAVAPEAWTRPRAAGKWSPAQVTEHLVLGFRAFVQEVRDGSPMRMRVGGLWLRVLRWFLLPHILFHRTFPVKAVSPREMRPGEEGLPDREGALRALRAAAAEAEREIAAARGRPGAVLTHPYFGGIELARALKFSAIHLEHHARQLRESAATGGRG